MFEQIVQKLTETERRMWLLGIESEAGKEQRDRALRLRSILGDEPEQQERRARWNDPDEPILVFDGGAS